MSILRKFERRLECAKFRLINELMYNDEQIDTHQLLEYHIGYESSVRKWPANPVDVIAEHLLGKDGVYERRVSDDGDVCERRVSDERRGKHSDRDEHKHERNHTDRDERKHERKHSARGQRKSHSPPLLIADVGCGQSKLSHRLQNVHSFDKFPVSPTIKQCDLEAIPAESGTYDCVVYSLSLMKRNIGRAVMEGNRVTRTGGLCVVAEAVSRIRCLEEFYARMMVMGFRKERVVFRSGYFVVVEFCKVGEGKETDLYLKECVYKKR